ncbi:hypothetical protein BWI93_12670 [Siphonobacter sp. BAB-5385]|uniref:hypothetical protein n=1 Tax=Siphonobacter sp. BAB-5385 TaxID=1864822 RepID=UPI000B9E1FB2|nr:hypothetical protein [Siphonobacter sp. BAB-5385]OZI07815.1 hypothetical protein BWI93_12670 [Siphonobacter sp. BAB-5385]
MIDEPEALSNAPNSPELSGKYLGMITADFVKVSEFIQEAAHQIRQRGFSNYPIFVACQQPQPLGSVLIGRGEMNDNQWYYSATFLEEFLQREIIGEDGEELFKESYKDPAEYACLFIIDADFTKFIFVPYPED